MLKISRILPIALLFPVTFGFVSVVPMSIVLIKRNHGERYKLATSIISIFAITDYSYWVCFIVMLVIRVASRSKLFLYLVG